VPPLAQAAAPGLTRLRRGLPFRQVALRGHLQLRPHQPPAGIFHNQAGVVEHEDAHVVLLRRLPDVVIKLRYRSPAKKVPEELAVDLGRAGDRMVEGPLLLLAVREANEDGAGDDERPDHQQGAGGYEPALQGAKMERAPP
jgi:hypothetical protein